MVFATVDGWVKNDMHSKWQLISNKVFLKTTSFHTK